MSLFDFFFKKVKVEEKAEEKVKEKQQPLPKEEKVVEEKPKVEILNSSITSNQTIISPASLDEIQNVVVQMRDKGLPALINLTNVDFALAQRYIDILCGAVTALNGNVTQIQNNIYYFTPGNKKF
jgi:cell division inhibitor SepF